MRLARFWSRQTADAADRQGRRVRAAARGWSDDSEAAASTMASSIAQRVAQLLAGGQTKLARYQYGERPIPEPVTREFVDASGLCAAVTRNVYGASVLNARDLMFVDVDVEPPPGQSGKQLLSGIMSIFGRKPEPLPASADPTADLVRAVADRRGLGMRLYKTAAGYRAIITTGSYDSTSPDTQALLGEFGSDPLYVRLCRLQASFRARLTPKPWRIGLQPPRVTFPYNTPRAQSVIDDWLRRYEAACATYSTCRFIGAYGPGDVAPAFTELIAYHDNETKATGALPLA